ncbi:hypothetical protein [Allorhodopirellula heiligendammensis]|uniref:hypothetical protein n=1 Tax=Allorhodopirellula heiligendammensis TaxID=2714739 RepID=UPI0011B701DD|nr:hypothetical protein [Allorhodopirellula heiligendammensis]
MRITNAAYFDLREWLLAFQSQNAAEWGAMVLAAIMVVSIAFLSASLAAGMLIGAAMLAYLLMFIDVLVSLRK